MDGIEILRAAHPGWSVESRRDGLIECVLGKYRLTTWGVASAGQGMTEWERQTGLSGDWPTCPAVS